MCGSTVDIQSTAAEIRRGIKKERRRKIEITGQKYNGLPYYIGQTIIKPVNHNMKFLRLNAKLSDIRRDKLH